MKTIVELGRCECRWPIDTAGKIMFCAAIVDEGSYCKTHRAIAFRHTPTFTDRSYSRNADGRVKGTRESPMHSLRPPLDALFSGGSMSRCHEPRVRTEDFA